MITCFVTVQWVYELCQSFYIFSKYVMIDLTNRHGCIERGVQLPEKNGGKRVRLWIFFRSEKKSSAWKCQEVCRQGGVAGRPERGWNNICGHHYYKSAHGQRNYHLLEEGEHLAKNRLVLLLAWLCLRDITLTNMHLCIYATHINRLIPFLPPGSPKVVVRKR